MPNLTLKDTKDGKFSSKYHGLWFYYDDNISIYWDTDKTFVVCRDGVTINSFKERETLTLEKAQLIADEWLGDMLQEEMLDHADEMYNEEMEGQLCPN